MAMGKRDIWTMDILDHWGILTAGGSPCCKISNTEWGKGCFFLDKY